MRHFLGDSLDPLTDISRNEDNIVNIAKDKHTNG